MGAGKPALVNYALSLQQRYTTADGKIRRRSPDDIEGRYASVLYQECIELLEKGNMTKGEMKASGLFPDKLFLRAP
jgi:hypothetical protein